jgi:hypothetical protein
LPASREASVILEISAGANMGADGGVKVDGSGIITGVTETKYTWIKVTFP